MEELTVNINFGRVKADELYALSHQVAHLEDVIYFSDDQTKSEDPRNPFDEMFPKAKKNRKKYKLAYRVENLFVPVEKALIEKGFSIERTLNLPQVKEGHSIPFYLGTTYILVPKDQ